MGLCSTQATPCLPALGVASADQRRYPPRSRAFYLVYCAYGFRKLPADVIPVQHRNHVRLHARWTNGLAGVVVGAVAEAFGIHGADHGSGTLLGLGLALGQEVEMGDLGPDEEHGGAVGAGGGAGTATDAGGGVHGLVGHGLGDEDRGGVGRTAGVLGDEAAGALDAVVGGAVDHKVLVDREGLRAEGLDGDGFPLRKGAHVDLAGRATAGSLRDAVDDHAAGAADAFAAVALKGDGILPLGGEAVIDDIEHLKERGLGRNVAGINILEASLAGTGSLPPDSEMEVHARGRVKVTCSCGWRGGRPRT